jgi:hypothetical protein
MTQFAIHPIFQIKQKTLPLVTAALAACLADPLFILILPRSGDASNLAIAQSLALAVGMVVLIGFAQANAPQWPRVRDLALTALGCAGMAGLGVPLRALPPGFAVMLAQIALCGSLYAVIVAIFDVAGLRGAFIGKINPILGRLRRKGGIFKLLLPL